MDILERIFGVETMARARAAAREAQARATATPGAVASPTPAAPRAVAPGPRADPIATVRALDDSFADARGADFPTSILGVTATARPPLLAAFASRDALLAAIVYAEALAPPVALR